MKLDDDSYRVTSEQVTETTAVPGTETAASTTVANTAAPDIDRVIDGKPADAGSKPPALAQGRTPDADCYTVTVDDAPAETTGFRDPERMRRAFIRAFGQPPQSLRRAARAGT